VDYHSAIPLVRAALAAAGVQAVDPWRASVKELLALLTEPAGFNVRLADDAERLGEFLDANEARIDSAAARARALLDGVGGPEHG
jgi:hypothetical protein